MSQFLKDLQHKINQKTKPLGALGRLEKLAIQIATLQNTLTPALNLPHILIFAADHGLANSGVSPYPQEVTAQMVLNFVRGGAAINVFANQNNIILQIIDAGVNFDFDKKLPIIHEKIAKGTKNTLEEPAMSFEQCQKAFEKGKQLVKQLHKQKCNVVGFGEMGIGNSSAAALLLSHYGKLPIEACVGRGTGLDDDGLKKKSEILYQVQQKHKEKLANIQNPLDVVATLGGFEIVMMAGAMVEAAHLKMLILIDGFIATSALLVAKSIENNIVENCIFCHQSEEQGHQKMLDLLEAKPLLNMGMRLGEGTGVAVAYPLIVSAVRFLNEMASFEEAGVSEKQN
ncbi:MAG: nicotinate-nucleotide--dimethylbenzimidazole phosphoribosyltransferase [Bacteroidetes bacterium]|nr:MAG: nicotinate-nucleotide--dimethylbenzimidazole phosphoribosyltransferase [Bacteroidota bacterium]